MTGLGSGRTTLTITVRHVDGYVELGLAGEVDVVTAPMLSDALDELIAAGHRDMRLNLSGLVFLDATGVGALVRARHQMRAVGGQLTLIALSGIPLRVLTICGLAGAGSEPGTGAHRNEPLGGGQIR